MQSIKDKFEFNTQLEVYIKNDLPCMEEIRIEPQVSALIRENANDVHKYLFTLLKGLNDSFKVNPEYKLNDDEIIDLVMSWTKAYFHYRIQDFAIFVRNAKLGKYGKTFNRFDVTIANEMIGMYDRNRVKVQDNNHLDAKGGDGFERKYDETKITDSESFRKVKADYQRMHNVDPKEKKD